MNEQMTLDKPSLRELVNRFEKGAKATHALVQYVDAYWKCESAKRAMNRACDDYESATGSPMVGDALAKLRANLPKLQAIQADATKFYKGESLNKNDPFEWAESDMRSMMEKILERCKEAGIDYNA